MYLEVSPVKQGLGISWLHAQRLGVVGQRSLMSADMLDMITEWLALQPVHRLTAAVPCLSPAGRSA